MRSRPKEWLLLAFCCWDFWTLVSVGKDPTVEYRIFFPRTRRICELPASDFMVSCLFHFSWSSKKSMILKKRDSLHWKSDLRFPDLHTAQHNIIIIVIKFAWRDFTKRQKRDGNLTCPNILSYGNTKNCSVKKLCHFWDFLAQNSVNVGIGFRLSSERVTYSSRLLINLHVLDFRWSSYYLKVNSCT